MDKRDQHIDPEDPRLTAYVLGELEGTEREEVEAMIAASPEARRLADELEATAGALREGLAAEAAGTTLERPLAAPARARSGRRWSLLAAAAVAGILVAVGVHVASAPGDTHGTPALTRPATSHEAQPRAEADGGERARIARYLELAENAVPADRNPRPPTPTAVGSQTRDLVGLAVIETAATRSTPDTTTALPGLNPSGFGSATGLGSFDLNRNEATGERYEPISETPFVKTTDAPLSTFGLDVDTASYANVRRFLDSGTLPPKSAVRIEELLNYFHYDDPAPDADGEHPVAIRAEVARCFWDLDHRLVRIGVRARDIEQQKRPASNLVFLVDVSGSMQPENKLPLLKRGLRLLVDELGENDRVAIVVYASATGLALPSTTCDRKEEILTALENLQAGGSTNGGAGIQLAYQTAVQNLIPSGTNRVILCTDGDFNVGMTDQGALIDLIQERARTGVFLSVLGFGDGNLNDATMERLADKGNGNYSYIDGLEEAKKVLVREMGGTLVTVAKDVKIQVEFNPARVGAWRLIGYENRVLASQDFNDDRKDAGDLGAGHTVTALYELVPPGAPVARGTDPLKYQAPAPLAPEAHGNEILTVKLRYKKPEGSTSSRMDLPLEDADVSFDAASEDFRFASAVAAFGLLLRDSPFKGTASFEAVHELANGALGEDPHGDRHGFLDLVQKAIDLISR